MRRSDARIANVNTSPPPPQLNAVPQQRSCSSGARWSRWRGNSDPIGPGGAAAAV